MKSDCLPCRVGRSHTFHDSGDPNLSYAFEGTEPPVQDSYQSTCNVAGCVCEGKQGFHGGGFVAHFQAEDPRTHRCEDCGIELAKEWSKPVCIPCSREREKGPLPPSQSSAREKEVESVEDIKRRAFQASCNVAGCSGDHDFEHDEIAVLDYLRDHDAISRHEYERRLREATPFPQGRDLCPHEGTPCKHCGDGDPDQAPLDLMQQAEDLVYGDRQSSYGHPYDDYSRTAGMWSEFLGIEITPSQAALMMVLLKISRERNRPKDDNIVDAHGYLLCYGRIQGREDAA